MAKVNRTTRVIGPARYVLPTNFSREIGRIMVHWAHFEHVIRHIAWDMIGVDHRMGRIAIRDPRIDDRLDLLLDIAYLKKISLDAKRIGTLKTHASEVLRWRDLLAHGIWIAHNDKWLLQMTSGQYPKNFEAEHRKRRINPEGINIDIEGLRSVTATIESLINEALNIGAEVSLSPNDHSIARR